MAGKILIRLNLLIFIALALINFLGVLMPELGFDALWYHLTTSKLYLFKNQWFFPGGLFYYSPMPRLAELISLPLLSLFGSSGPKFIQFLAGLWTTFLLYRLAKAISSDKLLSLTTANLFYATWLVSWQSSSAYVDLVRTAFETTALYFLISAPSRKILAGVFLGLAIGVKWHALGSLLLLSLIFSPLIIIPALLVSAPWFLIAYHFTGNPIYPLFENFMTRTQLSQVSPHFYALSEIIKRFVLAPLFITKPSEDFLSPVIGLVFVINLLALFSSRKIIRKISLYGLLGTFLLLLTPPPSTRYYLPYLPPVILSAIYILSLLKKQYSRLLIALFTLSALFIQSMRLFAFTKYLPYVTGKVSLNQFLASQSLRLPDTFIDADDYVKNNLPSTGSYLITNLHNLYYFPYDFDHDSFYNPDKHYDYLITKNTSPASIAGRLIHTNPLGIQIYKL